MSEDKNYQTLGNIGKDFYETIDALLETYSWDKELNDISFSELKEIIDDAQWRFDLKQNSSIAYIITKQIPIFERINSKYSISSKFKQYVHYHYHSNSFKEGFLKFLFNETLTNSFRNYCIELFNTSKVIKKTNNATVPKGCVKLIEHKLWNKYEYRKLLQDLGLIVEIKKGTLICDLRKFLPIIDHYKVAFKVIRENVDEKWNQMNFEPAKKLLSDFGFHDPREMLDLLRHKEMIVIRSIRSGRYLDFG